MTRFEAMCETLLVDPAISEKLENNIVAHPARASMGQHLAGKGHFVFEGELLELPLKWHPAGTRH